MKRGEQGTGREEQKPEANHKERLLVIVGPTAVGKSKTALKLAEFLDTEIIAADSMQVYKGMDVGTAKPTLEERKHIKHHLIDVVGIEEEFNVATYQKTARDVVADINRQSKIPILAGGSGLYIRSVIDRLEFPPEAKPSELRKEYGGLSQETLYKELSKLDSEAAARIHPKNTRRIIRALEVMAQTGKTFSSFQEEWEKRESDYDLLFFGLWLPREKLYRKIEERADKMIAAGLLQETKDLMERGLEDSPTAAQALGYKQIIEYLKGKISWEEAVSLIKTRSRQYAKRQLTWFRADPRIKWINLEKEEPVSLTCQEAQKKWGIKCKEEDKKFKVES